MKKWRSKKARLREHGLALAGQLELVEKQLAAAQTTARHLRDENKTLATEVVSAQAAARDGRAVARARYEILLGDAVGIKTYREEAERQGARVTALGRIIGDGRSVQWHGAAGATEVLNALDADTFPCELKALTEDIGDVPGEEIGHVPPGYRQQIEEKAAGWDGGAAKFSESLREAGEAGTSTAAALKGLGSTSPETKDAGWDNGLLDAARARAAER